MLIATAILLGTVGSTGLLLAITAYFSGNKRGIEPKKFAEKRRMSFLRGFCSFVTCGAAMLFLLTGYFDPFVIIVTVPLLLASYYALSRVNLHEFFEQLGKSERP